MKRSTDPRNRHPFVYDLDPEEIERFYRGTGRATVVVDVSNTIIACVYDGRDTRDADFLQAHSRPGTRWLEGIMSCMQFCAEDEGRIPR